tara:strand:+ start:658 stop:1068 length:411 start_codon:yes stop_codon:yes gene_type:complete
MNFREEKEFKVSSANLKVIRNFARELFEKVDELKDYKEDLVLALAEAAQNIIKHAYKSKETEDSMRVLIIYNHKKLTIELFDMGEPVIPENIKPRNLDDVRVGGLGTFFIGQIMDEVIFKTSKVDWVNHLTMTKKF